MSNENNNASAAVAGELSDEQIDEQIVQVWHSMPGGPDGWLKHFGFIQFARAVLAKAAPVAPVVGEYPDDFAKIVRGSNGQQVLFFKEVDADDGNTLHCVVNFPELQVDMKFQGLPDHAFAEALARADTAMADQAIAQVAEFIPAAPVTQQGE